MNIIQGGHGGGKTYRHYVELLKRMLTDKSITCAIFSQNTRDTMNTVIKESLKGYCKICVDLTLQDINSRLIDTEFTTRQEVIDKWLGLK